MRNALQAGKVVLQIMRTSERLTIGLNRSLRSLGRAKARPLTKRYALQE
jgi:hypothetical protein